LLVAEALGYAPLRVTGPQVDRVRAALKIRGGIESILLRPRMAADQPR
jgi:hypothetical protein